MVKTPKMMIVYKVLGGWILKAIRRAPNMEERQEDDE
jgi:hypothetical protein